MKTVCLKSIEIQNFKTFNGTFHIDLDQGLNVVLASSKYPLPNGIWDFFDAFRWGLGIMQHHGNRVLFGSNTSAQVKLSILDEEEKEIVIIRNFSKDSDFELVSGVSEKELASLQKYFTSEQEKKINFGSTQILLIRNDKEIAMKAENMIGITTDKDGVSKILELSKG